jgi:hypothetical protein
MTDDGVLTVTTPSGVTRTTRPPGWRLLPHLQLVTSDADDPAPF